MTKKRQPRSKAGGSKEAKKGRSATAEFSVIREDAAGIDIGGESHWVAVSPHRDGETVREFGALTGELQAMAEWLRSHGVRTVAMEATGVLWIPVYELLERSGFEVFLVNAAHVKNVSGRKTDVLDCQWIQKLHACGLLQRSFRPDDKTVVLRSYVRQRGELVRAQSASTLRMQKALTQMNLQLHLVVASITGTTGLAILHKLLDGERDPMALAELRDPRCRRSREEIAEALCGTAREEHLFALRQALSTWEHLQRQIAEVEQEIQKALSQLEPNVKQGPVTELAAADKRARTAQRKLGFDARTLLFEKTGTDLTAVLGINLQTALTVVSEVGTDMSRWPTAKHFSSWLGLSPNTRISGGKELSSRTKKTKNRAANALRMAASTLHRSDTPLGHFYRRKAHKGKPLAVTATAHRLARCVYALLKHGAPYLERRLAADSARDRNRQVSSVARAAARLGYSLAPIATEDQTNEPAAE